MADIDVVKKGPTAWIWIVVVLVALVLIIWFVMGRGNAPRTGRVDGGRQPLAATLISGVPLRS
jgi:bacteriorhodopsin